MPGSSYTMAVMRRLITVLPTFLVAFALLAPVALAQSSGEGTWGEADDRTVTNSGFIVIAAFPLLILLLTLLQWRLEKRKDARKKAAKARAGDTVWRGGW
jgi:hypothetical protein